MAITNANLQRRLMIRRADLAAAERIQTASVRSYAVYILKRQISEIESVQGKRYRRAAQRNEDRRRVFRIAV